VSGVTIVAISRKPHAPRNAPSRPAAAGRHRPHAPPAELPPEQMVLCDQTRKCRRSRRSNQPVSTINTIWSAEESITGREFIS